jgi:hypothetical protein
MNRAPAAVFAGGLHFMTIECQMASYGHLRVNLRRSRSFNSPRNS